MEAFDKLSFRVNELYIVERDDMDAFFTVRRNVPIASSRHSTLPSMTSAISVIDVALRQSVRDCTTFTRDASLHIVGSCGYGLAATTSDIDTLIETNGRVAPLANSVVRTIRSTGFAEGARILQKGPNEILVRARLFRTSTAIDVLISSSGRLAKEALSERSCVRKGCVPWSLRNGKAFRAFFLVL